MTEKLPNDWVKTKLGNICIVQGGFAFKSTSYINNVSGIPIIKIGDLQDGQIVIDSKTTRVPKSFLHDKQLTKYLLQDGDVLIAMTGATTGKVAKYRKGQCENVYLNQRVGRFLIQNERKADLNYIGYSIQTENFQNQIQQGILAAAQGNISPKKIEAIEILLPQFTEQQRIAYVLSTVQHTIEQQKRLIKLTRELKSALMHKLFTEGLCGEKQKMTEIGPVSESWDVVRLQDAVEYIDYGFSAPIPKTAPKNGVKIVSTADINREGEMLYWKIRRTTAPDKTINRLTLVDGDVLFNWRNSAELIGKTCIFEQQDEPHIFASFILRIRCDEKKTHNYFLKHLLNHYREQEVFIKLSRRAVNQANYNRNEIFELKIPFPKYEEQCEIAETIGAVESKIQRHESKNNLLEELFRTLLHQLMTGKTRVNNIDLPGFS